MRNYSVKSTMLTDPYSNINFIEPDKNLVSQFHQLLEMIPNDKLALSIDLTVASLIRFHNPNRQHMPEILDANHGN